MLHKKYIYLFNIFIYIRTGDFGFISGKLSYVAILLLLLLHLL